MKKRIEVKKITIALVLALIIPLFAPFFMSPQGQAKSTLTATTNAQLSVRSGAGTEYKVVGTLGKGTKVEVFSNKDTGWSEILFKSEVSYIPTSGLKFDAKDALREQKILRLAKRIRQATGTEVKVAGLALSVLDHSRKPVLVYAEDEPYIILRSLSMESPHVAGIVVGLMTGENPTALEKAFTDVVEYKTSSVTVGTVTFFVSSLGDVFLAAVSVPKPNETPAQKAKRIAPIVSAIGYVDVEVVGDTITMWETIKSCYVYKVSKNQLSINLKMNIGYRQAAMILCFLTNKNSDELEKALNYVAAHKKSSRKVGNVTITWSTASNGMVVKF